MSTKYHPSDLLSIKILCASRVQGRGVPSRAAGYIREKVWHESQEIEEQGDGSIVFEAEVAGLDEIRFWVMGWGSAAEVLKTGALREAERLVGRYEGRVEQGVRELGLKRRWR